MKTMLLLCLILSSFSSQALTNSVFAAENELGTVVFIKNDGLDSDGNLVPGYCNGTMISPNVIVTAAHCLVHAEALQKRQTTVEFGKYTYIQRPSGERVRVGYKTIYAITDTPQFRFLPSVADKIRRMGTRAEVAPGEDIAHIVLSKSVDLAALGQKPMPVLTVQEWSAVKNNLLQYAPMVVSVNPLAELSTTDLKRKASLNNLKISGTNMESRSLSRVEPGDSGSPVFVRIGTEWKLFAITKGMAKSMFGDWDMFTIAPGTL